MIMAMPIPKIIHPHTGYSSPHEQLQFTSVPHCEDEYLFWQWSLQHRANVLQPDDAVDKHVDVIAVSSLYTVDAKSVRRSKQFVVDIHMFNETRFPQNTNQTSKEDKLYHLTGHFSNLLVCASESENF